MKHKKPTEAQVKKEIETLASMKESVRRYSGFGDDNWAKIEAQIEALTDRMTIDETYDIWPDESIEGQEGPNYEIRNDAQDAIRWMTGEEKERPSEGWKPLMS